MKFNLVITALAVSISLSGCFTGAFKQHESYKDAHSSVENNKDTLTDSVSSNFTTAENGIWISGKENKIKAINSKSDEWLKEDISIVESDALPLSSLISYLHSYKDGIDISTTPAALLIMGGGLTKSSSGSSGSSGSVISVNGFVLDIHGDYTSLFDSIASQSGISWRVNGYHKVEFFVYENKIFHLNSLQTSSTQLSGSDNGAFSAKTTLNNDIWKELSSTLDVLKSSNGSISLSPSMGIVVVRDTPIIVDQISTIINNLNESLSKQLVIDIKVVRYKSDTNNNISADLSVAFATANRAVSLSGIGATITGASTATGSIIQTSSKYNGSNVVLGALDSMGETSLVVSRSLVVLNNTIAPYVVKSSQTYLAKVTGGSVSQGVATSPEVVPDVTNTSVSMFFYPRIVDHKIILQSDIKLESTDKIRKISTGTGANKITIEAPDTSVTFFNQTTILKDGQTLVLSGSDLNKSSRSNSLSIMGGSSLGKDSKDKLILIISVHIVS